MKLYYDVRDDHYLNGHVFLEMDGNDNIILQGRPWDFDISFISYAMSHESATMDMNECLRHNSIYYRISKPTPSIYDVWSNTFNYMRKGGGLIGDWYDPHCTYKDVLHLRGEYIPSKGKLFTFGYYSGLYMFIEAGYNVYVIQGRKPYFGKKIHCWIGDYMSADEVIEKFPKYKKFYPYLKWLEESYLNGKIKIKSDNVSINQQELKKYLKMKY